MSVKATPRVQWILAGILCLCTLVALWATAMSVREQKLAARRGDRGERIEGLPPPPRLEVVEGGPRTLHLKPCEKVTIEHFSLVYHEGTLHVGGSQERFFVKFIHLKKGEQRGWQELRLTVLDIDPGGLRIETEIRPGFPSTGDGWYSDLRAGLQIEFDRKRLVTVTSWDPAKPELKLRIQQEDHVEEKTLGDQAQADAFGIKVRLEKRALLLER